MSDAARVLWYVADPMCSWCFGFAPVLADVRDRLAADVRLAYVMGGLAPDTDEPMAPETRAYVQAAWDAVERRTGARFERAFWTRCTPRRSTWPACRAVVAARRQAAEAGEALFAAIQRAYYLEARNPSDRSTLVDVAASQVPELDLERFERELDGEDVARELQRDFALRDRLGVRGFPALVLGAGERTTRIVQGYEPSEAVLPRLASAGAVRRG